MTTEFYYCYSPAQYRFLRDRGVKYICTGLNENTMRQFWQYARTDNLNELLSEYADNRPRSTVNLKGDNLIEAVRTASRLHEGSQRII